MCRMLVNLSMILIFLSPLSSAQNLVEGQKELIKIIKNSKAASRRDAIKVELKYNDVNSKIAQEHTRELRAAQIGMNQQVGEEEIVFCLDNGINVQNVDGTGRRHLIAKGPEHVYFSYPNWSLDGKRIAFAAQRTDPRVVDLAVANSDGSNAAVILTLDAGYLKGFISSISWSWDSKRIMFTYYFDDNLGYESWVVCNINWTGDDLDIGTNPNRTFCQYDPNENSTRYAYIENVYPNTNLYVSNIDGSNEVFWAQYTGVISGFSHIAWNNANSIYTIYRYDPQYQNQELFIRLDRVGVNTNYTIIFVSDTNASLWTPTLSPDRKYLYNSEGFTNQNPKLWLTTLSPTLSFQYMGVGHFPNWRQKIPELQMPDKVVLLYPQNNSVGSGREDGSGIWVELGWNPADNAESYTIEAIKGRTTIHYLEGVQETSLELLFQPDTKYSWFVRAVNSDGTGSPSDAWNFTTLVSGIQEDEYLLKEYALHQNYPNPFNPNTAINYSIPKQSHVVIKVFDALGIEIVTLVNEKQPQGDYVVDFDGSDLTSGIYFYRIQADGFVTTKKMVLMK